MDVLHLSHVQILRRQRDVLKEALKQIRELTKNGHHPSMHGPEEEEFCAACLIDDVARFSLDQSRQLKYLR